MPMVAIFFVLGLAFSYFILLPFGLRYLQGSAAISRRRAGTSASTPSSWPSCCGSIAFETPLSSWPPWQGSASYRRMPWPSSWRYAVVGIAFVAAAITPTVDPVNMALVMGPLIMLYFLGVLMARGLSPALTEQF